MKMHLSLALMFVIALVACAAPQPTAPATAPAAVPTTAPEVKPTAVPPTQPPPTQPAAPATNPAPTKPPAPTDTTVPQPTATATAASATARPRSTPTSLGPLTAAIYVANCRSAPTAEKPGRVIIQISVEASGGNGKYSYIYQNKNSPAKFIDVIGERGTRSIGEVLVTSGDQQLKKEFDVSPADLTCP